MRNKGPKKDTPDLKEAHQNCPAFNANVLGGKGALALHLHLHLYAPKAGWHLEAATTQACKASPSPHMDMLNKLHALRLFGEPKPGTFHLD
ncbi:hypothetical protein ACULL5_09605 [Xanthomonas arboricola pv. corylina]|nr:hypothetical protein [Xanthomonas arboricola]